MFDIVQIDWDIARVSASKIDEMMRICEYYSKRGVVIKPHSFFYLNEMSILNLMVRMSYLLFDSDIENTGKLKLPRQTKLKNP